MSAVSAQKQPRAPRPRRRGRGVLIAGVIVAAAGIAMMVIGVLLLASGVSVSGFSRVAIADGSGTARFGHAGGYIAYYEARGARAHDVPAVPVSLTSPTGTTIVVDTPYGGSDGSSSLTYGIDGRHGVALYTFHIDQPGTYQVTLGSAPGAPADASIAFGKSFASHLVVGLALIIPGGLVLLVGLALMIGGLVLWFLSRRPSGNGTTDPSIGYVPPGRAGVPGFPQSGSGTWPPTATRYPPLPPGAPPPPQA